jgi:hypothetical protein
MYNLLQYICTIVKLCYNVSFDTVHMYYFSSAKKGRHYHLLPNFIFGYSKTEMFLFADNPRFLVDILFYFLPMIQLLLNVN